MSVTVLNNVEHETTVEKCSNDNKTFHPRTEDEGNFQGPKFDPPVYCQRYQVVEEMVNKYKAKKVIDFGCAEGKLMRALINHTSVEELVGVDIDRDSLEENKFRFQPLLSDYLHRRSRPLKVSTYKGSIAEADKRFCDCDLMACIEIIEHLEPAVLEAMPAAVFGCLSPKVAIVTTPNVEFNVLFPGLQGFRHWDHKFEWTRSQFEEWARTQATKYNYSVSFRGIGAGAEGTEHLGCVSQMALFEKEVCFDNEKLSSMGEPYALVTEVEYPYQRRMVSDEEKVLLEVEYLLWYLSSPDQTEDESAADGEHPADGFFSLDRLMEFPVLRKLCGTTEYLRSVVKTSHTLKLNDTESAIMWCRPESWSSNEDSDEEDWNTDAGNNYCPARTNTSTENTEEYESECWDLDIRTHTWVEGEFYAESNEEEVKLEEEQENSDDSCAESPEDEEVEDACYEVFAGTFNTVKSDEGSFSGDEEFEGDGLAWIEIKDEDDKPSAEP